MSWIYSGLCIAILYQEWNIDVFINVCHLIPNDILISMLLKIYGFNKLYWISLRCMVFLAILTALRMKLSSYVSTNVVAQMSEPNKCSTNSMQCCTKMNGLFPSVAHWIYFRYFFFRSFSWMEWMVQINLVFVLAFSIWWLQSIQFVKYTFWVISILTFTQNFDFVTVILTSCNFQTVSKNISIKGGPIRDHFITILNDFQTLCINSLRLTWTKLFLIGIHMETFWIWMPFYSLLSHVSYLSGCIALLEVIQWKQNQTTTAYENVLINLNLISCYYLNGFNVLFKKKTI